MAYLAMQAEAGVFCPVSMTDALARVLERYASEALLERFLPGLTALNMAELKQGAMFLTEKQGGSDVGQTATIAKRREDCDPLAGDELQPEWELWGDKWFCSNVSAELILTLARPEGASAGTRGLGLFLVPRVLDDGTSFLACNILFQSNAGTHPVAIAQRLGGRSGILLAPFCLRLLYCCLVSLSTVYPMVPLHIVIKTGTHHHMLYPV